MGSIYDRYDYADIRIMIFSKKAEVFVVQKRHSIRVRFIILEIATAVLIMVAFVLALIINSTKTRLTLVQKKQVVLLLMAQEIKEVSDQLTNTARAFVATGDPEYFRQYEEIVAWKNGNIVRPATCHHLLSPGKMISQHDLLKQLGCSKSEMELLVKSADLSNALVGVESQAMACIRRNKFVKGTLSMKEGETFKDFALRIMYDENYTSSVAEIIKPMNEFFLKLDARMTRSVDRMTKRMTRYTMAMGVSQAILFFWIIISLIRIGRAMIAPIEEISAKLYALGGGDLSVSMETKKKNEFARIAEGFNSTVTNIKELITSIQNMALSLSSVGEELSTNTTETASAMNEISGNIEGVKNQALLQGESVKQTTETLDEMMCQVHFLSQSIEKQAGNISHSKTSTESMLENISEITTSLQKTDDLVNSLSDATREGKQTISHSNAITQKITDESGSLMEASAVIQHIASQTNLLAMNAAIEAAHAGEAGKGFAVVADEIRKLAEESASQGASITNTLKTLSLELGSLSDAAKNAEEKFAVIFDLSEEVKSMRENLNATMKVQEEKSSLVLKDIQDINLASSEVSAGSAEMLKKGEEITGEIKRLDDLAAVISNSMSEMATGAEQVNKAVQGISEISQKNKRSMAELSREIDKFTV